MSKKTSLLILTGLAAAFTIYFAGNMMWNRFEMWNTWNETAYNNFLYTIMAVVFFTVVFALYGIEVNARKTMKRDPILEMERASHKDDPVIIEEELPPVKLQRNHKQEMLERVPVPPVFDSPPEPEQETVKPVVQDQVEDDFQIKKKQRSQELELANLELATSISKQLKISIDNKDILTLPPKEPIDITKPNIVNVTLRLKRNNHEQKATDEKETSFEIPPEDKEFFETFGAT